MPDCTTTFEKTITDQQIHTEINLPQSEILRKAKVIGRTKDGNGDTTGSCSPNPFINTLNYDVEFSYGEIKAHSANAVAKIMSSQVDEEGRNIQIVDSIFDCRENSNEVNKSNACFRTKSGYHRLLRTTSGQSLLILWENREEEWMLLNNIKKSLPLQTAEFAVARRIVDWQVPCTLRRRDRMIAGANKRVIRVTHKHGVELPTSVDHVKRLDEINGNNLWIDAINREIENLKVAFDVLNDRSKVPVFYHKASSHLVLDICMTLEREVICVEDSHKTPEPE